MYSLWKNDHSENKCEHVLFANAKPGYTILRQITDFVVDRSQNWNILEILEKLLGFPLF